MGNGDGGTAPSSVEGGVGAVDKPGGGLFGGVRDVLHMCREIYEIFSNKETRGALLNVDIRDALLDGDILAAIHLVIRWESGAIPISKESFELLGIVRSSLVCLSTTPEGHITEDFTGSPAAVLEERVHRGLSGAGPVSDVGRRNVSGMCVYDLMFSNDGVSLQEELGSRLVRGVPWIEKYRVKNTVIKLDPATGQYVRVDIVRMMMDFVTPCYDGDTIKSLKRIGVDVTDLVDNKGFLGLERDLSETVHDLKTPLTVITGYLGMILVMLEKFGFVQGVEGVEVGSDAFRNFIGRHNDDAEFLLLIDYITQIMDHARIASQNCVRMDARVCDILSERRDGAERVRERLDIPVDVGIALSNVFHSLLGDMSATDVQVSFQIEDSEPVSFVDVDMGRISLPEVSGSQDSLVRVLGNLLSNAIKYGSHENGIPRINIELRTVTVPVKHPYTGATLRYPSNGAVITEQKLFIGVSDNGSGISGRGQRDLFIDVGRIDQDDDVEGHGIGLTGVQSLCERECWEVSVISPTMTNSNSYVDSGDGPQCRGTCFGLLIPIEGSEDYSWVWNSKGAIPGVPSPSPEG